MGIILWGNGSQRYFVKRLSEINLIRAKYAIADIVQVGSGICSDRGVVPSGLSHWSVILNPGLSLVHFSISSRLNAVASGLSDAFIELAIVNVWKIKLGPTKMRFMCEV